MSERLVPWRSRPTPEVLELLEHLQRTEAPRIYVMQRTGPTSFTVREETCDVNRKVTIGCRPTCSCSSSAGHKELCLHIIFVMVRVLRVPPSNPLTWQLALTDRELEQVLRYSALPQQPQPSSVPEETRRVVQEKGAVKRKSVDEEEPCPICYEDMAGCQLEHLVWCKHGCGKNIHGKCMSVWSNHQLCSLGKELSCPLCRADWGPFLWKPPPPNKQRKTSREPRQDLHLGTRCGGCRKAPITGKRHKCLICADFDLCSECFDGGMHPQHPFACRETPSSYAVPSERAAMMPLITRLGVAATTAVVAGPLAVVGAVEGAGSSSGAPHADGDGEAGAAAAATATVASPGPAAEARPAALAVRARRRSLVAQAAAAAAEARLAAAVAAAATAAAELVVGPEHAALGNEELGGFASSPGSRQPRQWPRAGSTRPQAGPRRRSSSSDATAGGALDLVVGAPVSAPEPAHGRSGGAGGGSARVHRGLAGHPSPGRGYPSTGRGREPGDHDLDVILEGQSVGSAGGMPGHGTAHTLPAPAASSSAAAAAAGAGVAAGSQLEGLLLHRGLGSSRAQEAAVGPAHAAPASAPEQAGAHAGSSRVQGKRSSSRPAARARGAGSAAVDGHGLGAFHLDGRSVAPRSPALASPPVVQAAPPLPAVAAPRTTHRPAAAPQDDPDDRGPPARHHGGGEPLLQQQGSWDAQPTTRPSHPLQPGTWGGHSPMPGSSSSGHSSIVPLNELLHQGLRRVPDSARNQPPQRQHGGGAGLDSEEEEGARAPGSAGPPHTASAGGTGISAAMHLRRSVSARGHAGSAEPGPSASWAAAAGPSARAAQRGASPAAADEQRPFTGMDSEAGALGAWDADVAAPSHAAFTSVAATSTVSATSTSRASESAAGVAADRPGGSGRSSSSSSIHCEDREAEGAGAGCGRLPAEDSGGSGSGSGSGRHETGAGMGLAACIEQELRRRDQDPDPVVLCRASRKDEGSGLPAAGACLSRRSFGAADDVLLASVIGLGDALLGCAANGRETASGAREAAGPDAGAELGPDAGASELGPDAGASGLGPDAVTAPAGCSSTAAGDEVDGGGSWTLQFTNPVFNTSWTPSSSIAFTA